MNNLLLQNCTQHQLKLIKSPKIYDNIKKSISYINYENTPLLFKTNSKFIEKYTIIKIIYEKFTKGAYVVTNNENGEKYFIKVVSKTINVNHKKNIFNYMKNIKHKNIIKIVDYVELSTGYYFIYEYIEGNNLLEFLNNYQQDLPEQIIKKIFFQIVEATKFLHNNNIIHCDLKLDNIMILNDNLTIKIIDFGLSKICKNKLEYVSENAFGSDQYIAPESFDIGIYSSKSDVWTLGIILFIIVTQNLPFNTRLSFENTQSNLYRRNQFKHIDFQLAKNVFEKNRISTPLYELLTKMLTFNEKDRIDINDICEKFEYS
jgi:serine/threonine protein kinase